MAATTEVGEILLPKEAEAQALRPCAEEPLASPGLLPEPVEEKRKKQKGKKKAANLNFGFGPEPVRVLSVGSEAITVEVLPPSRYAPLRLQVCAQEWGRVWVNGRVLEPRDVVHRVQAGWRARVWQACRGAYASDEATPVVLLLDDEVVLGGRPRRRARVVHWLGDDGALGVAEFSLRDGDLAMRELALYRLRDLPPPSQVARPGQLVTLALSLDADALGDSNPTLAALTCAFYAISVPSAIDDIDDDVEYCNANPPRPDHPLPLLDDGASATLVARNGETHVMAKRIKEAASCSLIETQENGFLRMELPNEQLHPVLKTRCLIENLDSLEYVAPKMLDSSFTSILDQVTDSTNLFLSNFVPSNARDEEKLYQNFCDPAVNVMQPTCKIKTESVLKSKNTNVISEISKCDKTSEEANGASGESMKNVCDKLELPKSGNLEELPGPFSAKIIKVLPKSAVAEFSLNGLNEKAFFFKSSVVGSESPVLTLGADVVLESLEHVEQLHLIKIYNTTLKAGCVKICTEINLKDYPANVGTKDRIIAGESVKSTCDISQKSAKLRQPDSQMSNETSILKNDETCIANMCVSDTNTFTESSEGKDLDFDHQHFFPTNDRFFLELSSNNTLRFNENAVFLDSQIQNGPERDRCDAKTRMSPTSVSGEAEGKSCSLKPLKKSSSKQTENVRSDAQIVEEIVKQSFDEFKPGNSEELLGPFSAKIIKVLPKSAVAEFSLNGLDEKAFFFKSSVVSSESPVLTLGADVVLESLEHVDQLQLIKIYNTTLKAGCVKICTEINLKNYPANVGTKDRIIAGEGVKSTCDILQKSAKLRQPDSQMSNETSILKNDETCIANMCVSDTNTFTESSEGKDLDFDHQHFFPTNDRFFLELSSNNTLRFNENAVFLDSQIQNGPERDRCDAKTRMSPTSVSGEAEGKSCSLKPLKKSSSKQTENVRSDAQIVEEIVKQSFDEFKPGNSEELLGPFSAKIIKVLPKSAVAEFSLNGLDEKAFFFKSSVVSSESPVLTLGADVVLESLEHVDQLQLIKIYNTTLKAGCVKICTEINLKNYPANVGTKDRIIAGEGVKSTCDILQKSAKLRQPDSQMSNETSILKNDETCIANMCVSDTNTFIGSSEGKVLDFDQQHLFPSNDRFVLELSSNNTLRFNENAVFLDTQIQNGPERDRCHEKTRMSPTSVSGEAEGKSCSLEPLNKLSSKQTENVRSDAQIAEEIVKQSFDEFKPGNSEELIGPFSAKVIKVFPNSGIAEFSLNGHTEKAFFLKNSVSELMIPSVGTDVVLKNLERVKEGITNIYKTTLKAGCVKLHIKTCEHLNGRSGKIKNYVGDTGFVEVALPGKIFLVPFTKDVLKGTLSKNKSLKKMWPPGTQVHFHAVLIRQGDKEECNITSVWSHGNVSKTAELTQLIKCKQKDGQNGKTVNNPKNETVKNVEVIIEKVVAHTGVVSKFFSSNHGLIEFYVRNLYLRAEFKTDNCCGLLPEKMLDEQWPVSTVVLFNGDLIKNESDIKFRLSKVWLENPCIGGSLLWELPLEPCVGTVTELRLPQAFIVTINFLKDGKVLVFSTNYRASISDSQMNKSIPVYLGKKVWVKVRHLSYNAECEYIATTAWPDNKNGSEKPIQSVSTLSKRTEVVKTNKKIGTEDILRTTKDSSRDGTYKETKPMLQNGCVSRKTKNILPSQIPTDEKAPLHHQELERLPKLPAERAGPPHRARVTLAVNDAACFEMISYGDTLQIAASATGIALCGVAVAGLDLSLLLTPGQELDIHLLKEDEMKLNENSLCTSAYSKRCLYLPVLWIGSVHFKTPRLQFAELTIFCKKNKVVETVYRRLTQRLGQIINHDYQSKQENNEEDWNVKSGSPKISQERESICNTVSKIKATKEQESTLFKKENTTLKVESSSFDVESIAEVRQKLERMGPKGFLHAQLREMTQMVLEDSLSATREYFISSLKQNLIDPSLTEILSSEAHSIMLSAVEEFLQEKGKQAPSNGLPGVSASVPAPGVFVSRAAQSSKACETGAVAASPRTASVDAKDEQLSLLSPTDPAVVSSNAVEDGCGIPEKENSDDWTDVDDESQDTEGERWTRESVRAALDCLLDSARDALKGAQAELKATFFPSHLSCAMQGAEIEKSHAQKNIRELAVFRDEACRLIDNWKSAESPPATPEELDLLQELSSVLDNVTDGPDKDGDKAYNLARQLLKFWEVANFPLTPLAKRGLRYLQEVLKKPDRRESTVEMEHPSQSGGEEVQEVEAALREVHDAFRDVKHVFEVQRCFRDLRECFRDVRRAYRNREPRPRALPPCADAPTATVLTETVIQTKKRGRTSGDITGSRTPSPAGTPTHSLPKKKQQQHCATCKALVAGEKGEGLLAATDIVTTTTQTSNNSQAEVANLCQSTTMDFSGCVSTSSMDQASQTISTGPVLALQLLPDE